MDRQHFIRLLFGFGAATTSSQFLKGCRTLQTPAESNLPKEIHFGILTTEEEVDLLPRWQPFLADFAAAIARPVKPFFAEQYSSLIDAMRIGEIQIAWFGGKTYIEAATFADAEAFALTVSDKGSRGYYAHLITHNSDDWLDQVGSQPPSRYVLNEGDNLSFAFNDVNSTSGYLVPMYYLFAQNEIDPRNYFADVRFLGSHEATALAIANQEINIATNNSEALQRFANKYPDKIDDLRIIWTSPLIPGDPIAYSNKLPDPLKGDIRKFFYSYDNQAVLASLNWSRFDEATDKDWNPIRELQIGKQILDVERNESISLQEKTEIVQGLQQKLQQLKTSSLE